MNRYHTQAMEKHLAISKIFDMVEPHSTVLDVGCSTGFLGQQLKKEKRCFVVGIDNDKDAIKVAKDKLDKAIAADIENDKIKLKQKFDFIIFADVLEHTREPKIIIEKFKKFLKPGGHFLVSIPNVAHPLARLHLLLGKWDYSDAGILDRTHLRFYTRKTARSMLEAAGLEVLEEKRAGRFTAKKTFSTQFVFRCRPK